jgi:hypothetical protein
MDQPRRAGQRQATLKAERSRTHTQDSPRVARTDSPGAGASTCGTPQASLARPFGPGGGTQDQSSSSRPVSPESAPGSPEPAGPPSGQRVGSWQQPAHGPAARQGMTRKIRHRRARRTAPNRCGILNQAQPHWAWSRRRTTSPSRQLGQIF